MAVRLRPTPLWSLAAIALVVLAVRPPAGTDPGKLVAENVPYGPGRAQVLDVHAPEGEGPHPSLVVIHGGRWRSGDKVSTRNIAEEMAARGFVVVNMNYRLTGYPDPVDDVAAVISWVRTNISAYRGDHARIGLLGVSAGGHLGLLVAMLDGTVDAVASWSGPTDLPTLTLEEDAVEAFLGCDLALRSCRSLANAASPLTHVGTGDPAAFLANGTDEIIPQDQATRMASALAAAGVLQQLLLVEGDRHGEGLSRWALGPTADFLAAILGTDA